MPVPSFAYTNRSDGRVSIKSIGADGKIHWKIIGHMTDSTPGNERMVPNQYFRDVYQDLWTEAYPDLKIPAHELSIGMYALTLGVSTHTQLYSILQSVYGYQYVNNIMDYAMFLILDRSDVTELFEGRMDRQILFSDKLYSDSWYSEFFSKKLNEDLHHKFKIEWVQSLVAKGLNKVWLCIDGSNNDCEARQSFLTKYGFPKSHNTNNTIVGYMYAVNADTGTPVTYIVYEGSVPDSQAFQTIATFLSAFNVMIEGVILDRGFAVESVFQKITDEGWKYVVMLPSDTFGHINMMKAHSEEIRWKSAYVLEEDAIFGIAEETQLFGNHERTSNICLFFDGGSGSNQSIRLIKKIQKAKRKAEAAIAKGCRVAIEKGLGKYLSIEGEGCDRKIISHYDEWDKYMASSGFFSMAASPGMSPNTTFSMYRKRDVSETQFSILKSQEGGDTTRMHKTAGIYSKFFLLFVSSIIRHEIERVCKAEYLDTNPMIQGLNRIALLYTADDKYEAVRNMTTDQKKLLGSFDINQDSIERLAYEFNGRRQSDSKNPERLLPMNPQPVIVENTHHSGRQKRTGEADTNGAVEAAESTVNKPKVGRPKGKKDSKPRKPRSDKGKKRGNKLETPVSP